MTLAEMTGRDLSHRLAMPMAVKGGIGDFLQCLPFMMANPDRRYLVASHHDRVAEFFAAVGVSVEEVSLGRLGDVDLCPRRRFFDLNPFPKPAQPLFTDGRPVIGVHLGGSGYSLSVEQRFGFPSKALPLSVLSKLMAADDRHNFILFGSRHELAVILLGSRDELAAFFPDGTPNTERLKLVCADTVTESLSRVAECSALVGSDSAFKTMSAMLRIPTVVWVGAYMDRFRDENFIDPYVDAGIMSTFCYNDLSNEPEVIDGVQSSLERIRSVTG